MKLNKISVILTALGMFIILINGGCGGQPEITLDKVLSVSDFPYTMSDEQAVSMIFGGNNDNFINITIHRNNIYKGFSVNSQQKSNSNKISGDCTWEGKGYCQSSKHDTYIHYSIDKLNMSGKVVEVTLSAKFVDIKNLSDFIVIPQTTIKITDIHFENLMKKIS